MGTYLKGMDIPAAEVESAPLNINHEFLRLTTLFNTKKITKEEYRARVAELVRKHQPGEKGPQVVGFIVARER